MPDYSGYAQRPQQDPNLAAWAQIGGNIANIFGLDPAKAAEARRGLQQEDYNEQRNQAYIRQQLANKRIGELFSKIDPTTGEFSDPSDFKEYAGLVGELGGSLNPHYGTGYSAGQEQIRIRAEDRRNTEAQKRAEAANAQRIAEEQKKAVAAYQERLRVKADRNSIVKGRRYDPDAAINKFDYGIKTGFPGGWFEESPETKAQKDLPEEKRKYKMTAAFADWLNKNGYSSTSIDPALFNGSGNSSGALQDTANQLGLMLGQPGNHPQVLQLAKQVMMNQFADQDKRFNSDVIISDDKQSLESSINGIVNSLNQGKDPGVRSVIVRKMVRNPSTGILEHVHGEYSLDELLDRGPDGKWIFNPTKSLGENHPDIFFKR